MTIEREIALLEDRARNGRAMAATCAFEARECEEKARALRRVLAEKQRQQKTA